MWFIKRNRSVSVENGWRTRQRRCSLPHFDHTQSSGKQTKQHYRSNPVAGVLFVNNVMHWIYVFIWFLYSHYLISDKNTTHIKYNTALVWWCVMRWFPNSGCTVDYPPQDNVDLIWPTQCFGSRLQASVQHNQCCVENLSFWWLLMLRCLVTRLKQLWLWYR